MRTKNGKCVISVQIPILKKNPEEMVVIKGNTIKSDFIEKWAKEYEENEGKEEKINYQSKTYEQDIRNFSSIKNDLKQKGELTKVDLKGICKFKAGKRNHQQLEKNDDDRVKKITRFIINKLLEPDKKVPNAENLVQELQRLTGVGVKTASTILTVLCPEKFAILDFRATRTLLWKEIEFNNFREFNRALEAFRSPSPKDYAWYNEKINRIADKTGKTPREIDMALWKFDQAEG